MPRKDRNAEREQKKAKWLARKLELEALHPRPNRKTKTHQKQLRDEARANPE